MSVVLEMPKIDQLGDAVRKVIGGNTLGLPDIPEGYIRLTHVMPERSREILSSGEPFIYRKYGLSGTTDAYSDNDSIEWLAKTGDPLGVPRDGKPSNWSRNDFGHHMAIMDLPADAHKKIANQLGQYSEPIPNAAILGFVDRNAMQFSPNPRYDRAVIDAYGRDAVEKIRQLIDEQNRRFAHRPNTQELDIPPLPDFTAKPDSDVW